MIGETAEFVQDWEKNNNLKNLNKNIRHKGASINHVDRERVWGSAATGDIRQTLNFSLMTDSGHYVNKWKIVKNNTPDPPPYTPTPK